MRALYIPFSKRVQDRSMFGRSVRASYHETRNRIQSLFLFIKVIVTVWKRKLLVEVAEV